MFHNRTAWFSGSVRQGCRCFWMSEGGTISNWRTADYLFSEDATSPDTERIFKSEDYLLKEATVFHSLYLDACERRQSVMSVIIGHYVLPPACVQNEVREVVGRFIWEQEDCKLTAEGSPKRFGNWTGDDHLNETMDRSRNSEQSDTDTSQNEIEVFYEMEVDPDTSQNETNVSCELVKENVRVDDQKQPGSSRCSVC